MSYEYNFYEVFEKMKKVEICARKNWFVETLFERRSCEWLEASNMSQFPFSGFPYYRPNPYMMIQQQQPLYHAQQHGGQQPHVQQQPVGSQQQNYQQQTLNRDQQQEGQQLRVIPQSVPNQQQNQEQSQREQQKDVKEDKEKKKNTRDQWTYGQSKCIVKVKPRYVELFPM